MTWVRFSPWCMENGAKKIAKCNVGPRTVYVLTDLGKWLGNFESFEEAKAHEKQNKRIAHPGG